MSYRLTAVLMVAALSFSVAAFAAKGGKRDQASAVSPALLRSLNLTTDQQSRLRSATESYRGEVQKAQGLTDPKEKRQVLRQARQSYQTAMQSILTTEQQQQLKDRVQAAQRYRGLGPLSIQLAGLNLSDDQKTKLAAISDKYEPELQRLRASQKGAPDKTAIRGQVQDLQRKMTEEVKTVLTAEQLQQIQMKGRRNRKPGA